MDVYQSGEHSLEYKAVRKMYCKLEEIVSRGKIVGALFAKGVVEADLLNLSTTSLTPTEKGQRIMAQVLASVKLKPEEHFLALCEALETDSTEGINDVLAELKSESVVVSIMISLYRFTLQEFIKPFMKTNKNCMFLQVIV